MNITINTGAAVEDATQIDNIVRQIEQDMEILDAAIKRNIPSNVDTDWSERLNSDWTNYYGSDVPETMRAMNQSAENLRKAVQEALNYSQG